MNQEITNIEDEDLRLKLEQLEKYKHEIRKLSEEQDSIYEKVVALFVNGDNDFAFDYVFNQSNEDPDGNCDYAVFLTDNMIKKLKEK
jgi:bacterioferritin (cytochrome b1)